MSTPEASGTRQRTARMAGDEDEKTDNPASLSGNPNKKVARNKPVVKPPFSDISMNRFLVYLLMGLGLLSAFYIWRFTVYAHSVGGYWAMLTGNHHAPSVKGAASSAADIASSASSAASSAASTRSTSTTKGKSGSGEAGSGKSDDDVQSQIFNLANALGIKPAELSAAIRPLIDPSAPNPADVARMEAEALKQQMAASQAQGSAAPEASQGGSLLGVMGEALLD